MSELADRIEALTRENLALRCMLRAGCDANDDGPHAIVGKAPNQFCMDCGEMTPRGKSAPWFSEERLERVMKRLAPAAAIRAKGE